MKKVLGVFLFCAVLCFSGCALVHTKAERERRMTQSGNLQMRALVDDFDYMMLWDQTNRMTEYHVYTGYSGY